MCVFILFACAGFFLSFDKRSLTSLADACHTKQTSAARSSTLILHDDDNDEVDYMYIRVYDNAKNVSSLSYSFMSPLRLTCNAFWPEPIWAFPVLYCSALSVFARSVRVTIGLFLLAHPQY